MALNSSLTRWIDEWRAEGAMPDEVLKRLDKNGVAFPEATLKQYLAQPVGEGQTKAEVNPGEPPDTGLRLSDGD